MEEQINQILSILLASKKIPQLPPNALPPNDALWMFYNPNTQQAESTTNIVGSFESFSFDTVNYGIVEPSSGGTTSQLEIRSALNTIGFVLNAGEIKIHKLIVKKNFQYWSQRYIKKDNTPGAYGTGVANEVEYLDFVLISENQIDVNTDDLDTIEIDLGNIGSDSITNYINNNNDPSWDLQSGNVYIFSATQNGAAVKWLYVGSLPKLLGLGNDLVNDTDFSVIESIVWYWIDGSEVKKTGGTDIRILEVGDTVRNKNITNNGFPLHIVYAVYDGPDPELETSYTTPTMALN